jgi:hypothetical protein
VVRCTAATQRRTRSLAASSVGMTIVSSGGVPGAWRRPTVRLPAGRTTLAATSSTRPRRASAHSRPGELEAVGGRRDAADRVEVGAADRDGVRGDRGAGCGARGGGDGGVGQRRGERGEEAGGDLGGVAQQHDDLAARAVGAAGDRGGGAEAALGAHEVDVAVEPGEEGLEAHGGVVDDDDLGGGRVGDARKSGQAAQRALGSAVEDEHDGDHARMVGAAGFS